MSIPKKCLICSNGEEVEKVVLFNDNSKQKFSSSLKIRQKNSFKYCDVVLPEVFNSQDGYHIKCYRKFTALPSTLQNQLDSYSHNASTSSSSVCEINTRSNQSTKLIEGNASIFKSVCIFCEKTRKKHNGKAQSLHLCETKNFELSIKQYMNEMNDVSMQTKLSNIDFVAKEVKYHNICRVAYQNKYNQFYDSKKKNSDNLNFQKSPWHINRDFHNIAYLSICDVIEQSIIKLKKIILLNVLHKEYLNLLCEISGGLFEDSSYTSQHLEDKLKRTFENKVKFEVLNNKKIILHIDVPLSNVSLSDLKNNSELLNVAQILRREILDIKKKNLPENVSTEDLIKGECSLPDKLINFITYLVGGPDIRRRNSDETRRKVESLASDLVYAVTNGRVKPSKQLTLGITLKSLTSSRKVIDILNRYNQCTSYNVIEELETELTYSSINQLLGLCPPGVLLLPKLSTGVAFDNFDRFVETSSGKDTLHDTVGILYQNEPDEGSHKTVFQQLPLPSIQNISDVITNINSTNNIEKKNKKKRRTFEAITPEVTPYRKKPKMIGTLVNNDNELRQIVPNTLKICKERDLMWVLSHALKIRNTTMWTGYNSLTTTNHGSKQKIFYLTPINMSPTNTTVIYETMVQAQKIANECHQNFMSVTYDLAIAKVALQIQTTEQPKFDNLFINLGAFHIMMAYFKAVGKFIDECGITYIMVESELLASGSVNGFITGKHFNRCKRLYPIIALGLQILHFELFLEKEYIDVSEDILLELEAIMTKSTNYNLDLTENENLKKLINLYSQFQEDSLSGLHGKTAQYYMNFIQLVDLYLILSKSIRVGDFKLFCYILPKITNLFFIFNQPNYARWMVKYHDNILKLDETHPDLKIDFESGSFGIKRTSKSFSRQPIDLTLEQTINADASKRLTGVIHFTNSISARQRWAKSHSLRSTIISHVLESIGLKSRQDISNELEKSKIEKASSAVQKFIVIIKNYINPFDQSIDPNILFNILTGKGASTETTNFLLNVQIKGNELREKFISNCAIDSSRFEKPIEKQKILNFSQENIKKKIGTNVGKVQEIRMQRNLFGRMLGISLEKQIDVLETLKYPLTPIPTSMCHLDGTMYKTDKSALMKILEQKISQPNVPPEHPDVAILDGFFVLHLIREFPKTFGSISIMFLKNITRYKANRIDIVFDQYFSPSIKDNEHKKRTPSIQNYSKYVISGPDQTRPADFIKELRNGHFKEAFVDFLIEHWIQLLVFIGNKIINLSHKNCNYTFIVHNGKVLRSTNELLSCNHEEADTKIIYHLYHISKEPEKQVIIRCNDTDVLIIILGNMYKFINSVNVWLEVGLVSTNNLRYIDVSKLFLNLGIELSTSLLAFHALTGCDFTPAFYRKGKQKPFKLLEKNTSFQKSLSDLGRSEKISSETFSKVEKFVCQIYGIKNVVTVNEARFEIFCNAYKPKKDKETFKAKLKNCDSSNIPPCHQELQQQILRVNYVCSIWRNAISKTPTTFIPVDNGWIEEDNSYIPLWFKGPQYPAFIEDVVIRNNFEGENISDNENEASDTSGDESD
ncbi:hypothetical protein QTP88_017283 [Uroleucon formosanum]